MQYNVCGVSIFFRGWLSGNFVFILVRILVKFSQHLRCFNFNLNNGIEIKIFFLIL